MFFWLIKILCYIPFWLLYPVVFKGKKIPKGKVVLISNHISNCDPLILLNMIWRSQYVISKKELFKSKIGNAFFRGMKAIPVDREKVEISTIKQSLSVLKKGKILTIFPEGTRNKTDQPLLEIKNGASIFAYKANAPIVPVWFSRKPRLFRLTKVYIGEPFYITKDNFDNSGKVMEEKLLELRSVSQQKKHNKNSK